MLSKTIDQLIGAINYYELCLSQSQTEKQKTFYKTRLDKTLTQLEKINRKEYLRAKPTVNIRMKKGI